MLRRHVDPDVLDRLEQSDLGVDERAVERTPDSWNNLCRSAVDRVFVESSVVEPDKRALDGLAGQWPLVECFLEPLDHQLHRLVQVLDTLCIVNHDIRPENVLDVLGGFFRDASVLERLAALEFGHVHRCFALFHRLDDVPVKRFDANVKSIVAVRRDTFNLGG